jgi:hypothetical protein
MPGIPSLWATRSVARRLKVDRGSVSASSLARPEADDVLRLVGAG